MKEEKQKAMAAWLEGKAAEREARRKALQADDRADEAAFEKIAGNVYDIFHTILGAAEKACKGEESAGRAFFLRKLEEIPACWQASYAQAEQHGDGEKTHIEAIKLAAAAEIRAECERIWGDVV